MTSRQRSARRRDALSTTIRTKANTAVRGGQEGCAFSTASVARARWPDQKKATTCLSIQRQQLSAAAAAVAVPKVPYSPTTVFPPSSYRLLLSTTLHTVRLYTPCHFCPCSRHSFYRYLNDDHYDDHYGHHYPYYHYHYHYHNYHHYHHYHHDHHRW